MHLFASILTFLASSGPVERQLDAGTWVRQSLTVLPVSVQECPSYETFEQRAWARLGAEVLVMLRPRARAEAREEKSFCDEARSGLIASLSGDWSRLTSMGRFDTNTLPADLVQKLSAIYKDQPIPSFAATLGQLAGDTLRGLLADKALERSAHLQSDQQQNSAVATKMRTQDVVDEELALLRGSAHVLALRATWLDVRRPNSGKGLEFRAGFQTGIWSFDPVARTFAQEAAFERSDDETSHSGASAGASVGSSGGDFTNRFLDLQAFRFTTQILSGNEGWWLRPASKFSTNTAADLSMHRRFRYMETRAVTGGSDKQVQAGYGYVDRRNKEDSSWRLRHIGGIKPYSGLVLEEIPGNTWGIFSGAWVSSTIEDKSDTNDREDDRWVSIRHTSPILEFRIGARSNLGNLAHNHFLFDLPIHFGSVAGALNQEYGSMRTGSTGADSVLRLVSRMPTSFLWGIGLEPGWCFRFPVRRLFFTGGVQAGLRFNFISLGEEEVVDQFGRDQTWRFNEDDLPLTKDDARELMNIDGTVSLRGGLQWSLTPWSGLGFEVMYDLLRGEGGQSYRTGSVDEGDWTSVGGPTTGQGRLRWMLQYVWK